MKICENNVGKIIEEAEAFIEVINEETTNEIIKKYNLVVEDSVKNLTEIEAALVYDKKGGKEQYLLLLPRENGFIIDLNTIDATNKDFICALLLHLYS